MEKSTSIVNIAKALLQFHVKVGKIKKDANNPFFKSKYASLSNILDEIETPLLESGLTFSQMPTGSNGLITILIHAESGEYIQSEYFMQPIKNDPQATGSAISYARRYALTAILALNVDDDDANAATHGHSTPQQAAKQATKVIEQNGSGINGEQTSNGEKPWLDKNSKKYDLAVERLKNKTTTLSQLSQYFKLNKDVRAELQKIVDEAANIPA